MRKFTAYFSFLLCLVIALTGCAKAEAVSTPIGDFAVSKVSYLDAYSSLTAPQGSLVMKVVLSNELSESDLLDKARAYFCPTDGSEKAMVGMGDTTSECEGVSIASSLGGLECALIFIVPESFKGQTVYLRFPGLEAFAIK